MEDVDPVRAPGRRKETEWGCSAVMEPWMNSWSSSSSESAEEDEDEVGVSGGVGGRGRSRDEQELARALSVVVVTDGGGGVRRLQYGTKPFGAWAGRMVKRGKT